MFDIGWSELLVIGVVAVIVVGPKELPRLMGTFGHYVGKLRRMAADFQRQFEEAVRDSEIDEVRKAMQDFHAEVSDADPRGSIDKPLMTPRPAQPASAPAVEATAAPKPKRKPRAKKAKTVSAKTVSAKTVPAKTVPAKTVPAKTVPAKTVPAKTVPAKSLAAKTIPAEAIPAETVPTKKTAAAKTASTKSKPAAKPRVRKREEGAS
jgi:sec-independent protein translocase protein TatB